jgi:hypothetical protein
MHVKIIIYTYIYSFLEKFPGVCWVSWCWGQLIKSVGFLLLGFRGCFILFSSFFLFFVSFLFLEGVYAFYKKKISLSIEKEKKKVSFSHVSGMNRTETCMNFRNSNV